MKTNNIKTFAKKARLMLLDGVTSRLKYWGFNEDGSCSLNLEATAGGYSFRGRVFNDPSVPAKWNKLKNKLKDKQAVEDVVEQAAYTWFNRLMAIKILEVNGYVSKQLAYANGTRTPMLVQNAKRGQHELRLPEFVELLNEHIRENREEEAFGLLLIRLCTNNKLLYDVFGKIDDYTEILLPQNLLQKDGLMDLLNADLIAEEDYKEVELIGWLYQFYISDKKDKVFADFKKNKKARAEDIPAATQIFTPKWIVKYMVENTVGKLYLDYEPASTIKAEMKYLVENENEKQTEPIISDINQLTLLDPASGSGHILVTGFDLLFRMYKEEGYASKQAVENILTHNLWGLDIDDRAVQLARFAVLLKAAQYDEGILGKAIIPQIYSFPEAEHFTTDELHTFIGSEGLDYVAELKDALSLLNQGKNIGSALKFDLDEHAINYIKNRYDQLFEKERTASLSFDEQAIWYRLKPFLDVLLVITQKYTAVVANPPYMGQKSMNDDLKEYLQTHYPLTYGDLSSVFMDVCYHSIIKYGYYSIINQASWMLKPTYVDLRNELINKSSNDLSISALLYLGPGVFEEIKGEVVQSVCFVVLKGHLKLTVFFKLNQFSRSHEKERAFLMSQVNQYKKTIRDFRNFSGKQFGFWLKEDILESFRLSPIRTYGDARQGIKTGDNSYFIKYWHEVSNKKFKLKWFPVEKGGPFKRWYGNNNFVLNWENQGFEIKNFKNSKGTLRSRPQNLGFFFTEGLTWSTSAGEKSSFRFSSSDFCFESSGSKFFISNNIYTLLIFLGFFNSKVTHYIIEVFAPGIGYSEGSIKALPFVELPIIEKGKVHNNVERVVEIARKDWDSRETSWDFPKSPLLNETKTLKQTYTNWVQDVTNDFFTLQANEEELNRIFIDIYGLQDELTPDVALKDITILQDEIDTEGLNQLEPIFREHGKDSIELPINKEEVLNQFVSYCIGLMMGRYRLDKQGLNIAHPNPTDEETASYQHNAHTIDIDDDAIVPLMGKDGAFSDDALLRLKHIILALWGEDTLIDNLNFLQDCLGASPHKWLTEKFWAYHTHMYKKKPIYWLFTSNPKQPHKAAFRVLTYMHRMNRFTVQQIQRNYLHPHQEHIGREIEKLKENEETLSKQEVKKLETLQEWEVECRNYNEVLKDLANRQIEFDLDDGVSVNYAKFEEAVAKI